MAVSAMPHLKQTLQHCGLYAGFELRRLWLTRRGLMTLAATAVIWFFLLRYARSEERRVGKECSFRC